MISFADYLVDADCSELVDAFNGPSDFRLFDTYDGTDEWFDKYDADVATIADALGMSFAQAQQMDMDGMITYGV